MARWTRREPGFTLTELMVTLGLMTIVGAIVVSAVLVSQRTSRVQEKSVTTQVALIDAITRMTRDISLADPIVAADGRTITTQDKRGDQCARTTYQVTDENALTVTTSTAATCADEGGTPSGRTTVLVEGLVENPDTAVFTYFDKNDDPVQVGLTGAAAANTAAVARVGLALSANVVERDTPVSLETSAVPRKSSINQTVIDHAPLPAPLLGGDYNAEGYPVLSWPAVPGATGYWLLRNGSTLEQFNSHPDQYVDEDLTNGERGYYQVFAINDAGLGPGSNVVNLSARITAPVLSGTANHTTVCNALTWTIPTGTVSFSLYEVNANDPDITVRTIATGLPADRDDYDDCPGAGTTTTYRVVSHITTPGFPAGTPRESNPHTLTLRPDAPPASCPTITENTPPAAYTDVTQAVTVNASPGATAYRIERVSDNSLVYPTNGNTAGARDPGSTSRTHPWGTHTQYRAIASNQTHGGADSPPRTINCWTRPAPPPVQLTTDQTRRVTAVWSHVDGGEQYRVWLQVNNGAWQDKGTVSRDQHTANLQRFPLLNAAGNPMQFAATDVVRLAVYAHNSNAYDATTNPDQRCQPNGCPPAMDNTMGNSDAGFTTLNFNPPATVVLAGNACLNGDSTIRLTATVNGAVAGRGYGVAIYRTDGTVAADLGPVNTATTLSWASPATANQQLAFYARFYPTATGPATFSDNGYGSLVTVRTCAEALPECLESRDTDPPAARVRIPAVPAFYGPVRAEWRVTRVRDGVIANSGVVNNLTGQWNSHWINVGTRGGTDGWGTALRWGVRITYTDNGVTRTSRWVENDGCVIGGKPQCPSEFGAWNPGTWGVEPTAAELRRNDAGNGITFRSRMQVTAIAFPQWNATTFEAALVGGQGATTQTVRLGDNTETRLPVGARRFDFRFPLDGAAHSIYLSQEDEPRLTPGTQHRIVVRGFNAAGVPTPWCSLNSDWTYPEMQTIDNDTITYWQEKENSFFSVATNIKRYNGTGFDVIDVTDKADPTQFTPIGQRGGNGLRFPWWGQVDASGGMNQFPGVGLSRSPVADQQTRDGENERIPFSGADRVNGHVDYFIGAAPELDGQPANADPLNTWQRLDGNMAQRTRYSLNWQYPNAYSWTPVKLAGAACIDEANTARNTAYCTRSWKVEAVGELLQCLNRVAGGNVGQFRGVTARNAADCRAAANAEVTGGWAIHASRNTSLRAPRMNAITQINGSTALAAWVGNIPGNADAISFLRRATNRNEPPNWNLLTDAGYFSTRNKVVHLANGLPNNSNEVCTRSNGVINCIVVLRGFGGNNEDFQRGQHVMVSAVSRKHYGGPIQGGQYKHSGMSNPLMVEVDRR